MHGCDIGEGGWSSILDPHAYQQGKKARLTARRATEKEGSSPVGATDLSESDRTNGVRRYFAAITNQAGIGRGRFMLRAAALSLRFLTLGARIGWHGTMKPGGRRS